MSDLTNNLEPLSHRTCALKTHALLHMIRLDDSPPCSLLTRSWLHPWEQSWMYWRQITVLGEKELPPSLILLLWLVLALRGCSLLTFKSKERWRYHLMLTSWYLAGVARLRILLCTVQFSFEALKLWKYPAGKYLKKKKRCNGFNRAEREYAAAHSHPHSKSYCQRARHFSTVLMN